MAETTAAGRNGSAGRAVRVLVTGASGFVGGALMVRLAADPAFEVVGIGRRAVPERGRLGEYRVLDLARDDADALLDALPAPDVIVHAAARSSPWGTREEFARDNVEVTARLLAYASRLGTVPRVVFVSTASVLYRARDQLGVTGDAVGRAPFVSDYAASKDAAERLVREYPGDWVVLRPRAVFGPGDTTVLPRLLAAAEAGRLPVFRSPRPVRSDLVHVDTLVEYLVRATTRPEAVGRTLVVTGGEPVELQAEVARLLEASGLPAQTRTVSRRAALLAASVLEAAWRIARRPGEPPLTRYSVIVYAFSKTFDDRQTRAALGEPLVSTPVALERLIAEARDAPERAESPRSAATSGNSRAVATERGDSRPPAAADGGWPASLVPPGGGEARESPRTVATGRESRDVAAQRGDSSPRGHDRAATDARAGRQGDGPKS